jgi:inosine-uridine nucleoside N-ribohydrolase/formylmethanofuran dehydrogenase subunit E
VFYLWKKEYIMRRTSIILLLFVLFASTAAHPWKPANFVIIDTDGGFDDMRAITMFLASPNVRVLAITSSNGVVNAGEGYRKVGSLLNDLHHEGILTGMNDSETAISKNCQPAIDFRWGNETGMTDSIRDAIDIVNYVLCHTQEQISFVCLGSLATADLCYKKCAQFKERVKEIVWTSDSLMNNENFNYSISPASYEFVTRESGIPLHIIFGTIDNSLYNENFRAGIQELANPYSSKVSETLMSVVTPYAQKWFDEMSVVYLHYPFLFSSDTSEGYIIHKVYPEIELDSIRYMALRILEGNTVNQNQVLVSFPLDTAAYFSDVRKNMQATIKRYGKDEWVASVLGNELHRHLGVYAVIGVKMGIRAREYFGAGIDEIQVNSYAGLIPPYSCLNDGLQVSTGATLGHGLIRVDTAILKLPKAEFTYLGQTIGISLKEEYRKKIEGEIQELSMIYGLNNNIYWELVRMAALNYWSNWDRHEIFDIYWLK